MMKTKQKRQNLQRKVDTSKVLDSKKTFLEHFQELKQRFIVWLILFLLFSSFGYFLKDKILDILIFPLNEPLYYSSPAGGFSFTLSISFFFGFLTSLPVLIYQILGFLNPIIPQKIKNKSMTILLFSFVLMLLGISFAYFISLPAALKFLSEFGGTEVKSLISTSEYFNFVSRYLIGFGIIFQLPLIMLFVNKIKKLTLKSMLNFERWIILISFTISAVLTPTPDIINQLMMALPIVVLYQISIVLVLLTQPRPIDSKKL